MLLVRSVGGRLAVIAVIFGLIACSPVGESEDVSWVSQYVKIRHRDEPVDVGAPYFESLDSRSSSVIDAAWYDEGNQYLVIVVNGTPYHYCSLTSSVWEALKVAPSLGSFYNRSIRGRFNCSIFFAPDY